MNPEPKSMSQLRRFSSQTNSILTLNVSRSWRLEIFDTKTLELLRIYFPFESSRVRLDFPQLTQDQLSLIDWWASGPKEWSR